MPNSIEDISSTLERGLVLRRFNKDILRMEEAEGSDLNKIVGVGSRVNPRTGKTESVTSFYPDHFGTVVKSFADFPIYKHFGITVKDAMDMPLDQWYDIERKAMRLEHDGGEIQSLIQLVKDLVSLKGEGE